MMLTHLIGRISRFIRSSRSLRHRNVDLFAPVAPQCRRSPLLISSAISWIAVGRRLLSSLELDRRFRRIPSRRSYL